MIDISAQLFSGLIGACTIAINSRSGFFLFVGLFVFSPLWAEHINFELNHASIGLGALFGSLAGFLSWRVVHQIQTRERSAAKIGARALTAAFLFSLSASCNQALALLGLMTFLLALLNRACQLESVPVTARVYIGAVGILFAVFGVGLLLYAAEVTVARAIADVDSPEGYYGLRSSLVSTPEELAISLNRLGAHLYQFFFRGQHLYPFFTKVSSLLGALTFLCIVMARVTHSGNVHRLIVVVTIALVIAGFILTPWSLGVLRVPDSYRYNGIVGASLIGAGFFALAVEHSKIPLIRSALQLLGIGVVATFVLQHNIANLTTHSLNQRDLAISHRILDRIESNENYRKVSRSQQIRVLTVGTPSVRNTRPFATLPVSGPMDSSKVVCGIFNCQMGRLGNALALYSSDDIEYEVHHYDDTRALDEPQLKDVIDQMQPWPTQSSVRFLDDGQILILFSSKARSDG